MGMGQHFKAHGVSKYRPVGNDGLYRVQLPHNASSEERQLHDRVVKLLDHMGAVQKDALDMLLVAETVLGSEDLVRRPVVQKYLGTLFALPDAKPTAKEITTILANVVRTRTGLEKDGQVKFKRLTEASKEANTVTHEGWSYGATSELHQQDYRARSYGNSTARLKAVKTQREMINDPVFDDDDDEEFREKSLNKMKTKLAELERQYELDARSDAKLAQGKLVAHQRPHEEVYFGRIKLDMFTFAQRIEGGEQVLVSRTLVHEATHRHAGTDDHAYCKPESDGFKFDLKLTTEQCVENADSYAHFCWRMWEAKKSVNNFG
jgi:hypothetical protein